MTFFSSFFFLQVQFKRSMNMEIRYKNAVCLLMVLCFTTLLTILIQFEFIFVLNNLFVFILNSVMYVRIVNNVDYD